MYYVTVLTCCHEPHPIADAPLAATPSRCHEAPPPRSHEPFPRVSGARIRPRSNTTIRVYLLMSRDATVQIRCHKSTPISAADTSRCPEPLPQGAAITRRCPHEASPSPDAAFMCRRRETPRRCFDHDQQPRPGRSCCRHESPLVLSVATCRRRL